MAENEQDNKAPQEGEQPKAQEPQAPQAQEPQAQEPKAKAPKGGGEGKEKKDKGGGEGKGKKDKGGGKEKQGKKPKGDEKAAAPEEPQLPAPPPRLYEKFRKDIVPALQQKFGYKNILAVPRLEKIVISMGLGRFATAGGDGKAKIEMAEKELVDDRRPEAPSVQGPQERRELQGSRRHGDGPEGDVAGRADVRVPRPHDRAGDPAREGLPRAGPRRLRQERQLQLRVQRADGLPRGQCGRRAVSAGHERDDGDDGAQPRAGRELLKQFGMPFRDTSKQEK